MENVSIIEAEEKLLTRLRGYERVVVAFSGGIDSTVVACAETDPCVSIC